jgi:hypothetical protein
MRGGVRIAVGGLAIAGVLGLAGCTWPPGDGDPTRTLPVAGSGFDYQLGGGYEPPADAEVIARDSTEAPAEGHYGICYVNGFQTQPGEGATWLDDHPHLVLRDAAGEPVVDPAWPDEYLLDTSTAEKRAGIQAELASIISTCRTRGYDAVEIDNLDSWSRSDGALTIEDNIAHARDLAEYTHALGLAIAQKNGAGYSQRLRDEVGFDFAVTEECMRYDECSDYIDAYDGLVFDIEYLDSEAGNSAAAFAAACDDPGHPDSMILRDLALSAPGDPGYVRETC